MVLYVVVSAVGLALTLLTLPLVLEVALLTGASLFPKRKRSGRGSTPGCSLCVVVPAHNEEALIGRCVQSLSASAGPNDEVLVVAHNCSDDTANEARRYGARVLVLNDREQKGKGNALKYGFAAALESGAQAVLVIDADSKVDVNLIPEVKRGFEAGALAQQCRYSVLNPEDSDRTRLMAVAFQGFNVIRPRGRSRMGLSAGVFGNGFSVHRDVLERVPYSAFSLVEDLEYHLLLVQAGIRVEFLDSVAVYGEIPVSEAGSRTQRARWEGGRMQVMRAWAPRLMKELLHGRIVVTELVLDLLTLPIATGALLLLAAVCIPLPWLRVYALSALAVLGLHVMVAAASGPGFLRTMRALLSVPGYMLWKIQIIPEILRGAGANAAWQRTERQGEGEAQQPQESPQKSVRLAVAPALVLSPDVRRRGDQEKEAVICGKHVVY